MAKGRLGTMYRPQDHLSGKRPRQLDTMHLTAGIRVKDGELWAEEGLRSPSGFVDDIVIPDDGAHNRTVKVDDGTPTYYTYNAANQMLTETTGAETTYYHYDGCGNTTTKQAPAGTTYYQYDTENLMTRIDFPDNTHSYYTYDADSKRVSQRTADGYSEFIYQGPDMLKLQMERDEAGDTKVQYTMGNGLEAMRRDAGSGIASGDSSFYHCNHLGTTIALTDASEAVSDTYRHDAWGVRLASTGSTVNPHTYVGQQRYYRMPNASLYHLGFRDYAQRVGRFTTVDPIRETSNWYGYVRGRPLVFTDPEGLKEVVRCRTKPKSYVWLGLDPDRSPDVGGYCGLGFFPFRLGRWVTSHYKRVMREWRVTVCKIYREGPCGLEDTGHGYESAVWAPPRVKRFSWKDCVPLDQLPGNGVVEPPTKPIRPIMPPPCQTAWEMFDAGTTSHGDYTSVCMACCNILYTPGVGHANTNCKESCGTGGAPTPGNPVLPPI